MRLRERLGWPARAGVPWMCVVAVLLAGCGRAGVPPEPTWTPTPSDAAQGTGDVPSQAAFDEDGPVLQIEEWPGFIAVPLHSAAKMPLVTIWGNGRAVFELPEDREDPQQGLIREAMLDRQSVERLVSEASMLYDAEERLEAYGGGMMVIDGGSVVFSVWSEAGRKSVKVDALNLEGPLSFEGDRQPLMDEFRALYRTIVEALPADAPMMAPDEVTVATHEATEPFAWPTQDWPSDLVGHLVGEDVERALEWLDVGPVMAANIDGVPHHVTIIPVLPVLSQPALGHPPFPLAPQAIGYRVWGESSVNGPARMEYRFEDGQAEEIAGWYRYVMPKIWGWRAPRDTSGEQVWVLDDPSRPEIVEVRFAAGHYTVEPLRMEGGYPQYPDGEWGSCGRGGCQYVAGLSVEEARDWFAEYLGYIGWEGGPYVFQRPWPNSDSYDQLTVTYREQGNGVVFAPNVTFVHPNDTLPYPTPTEDRQ